MILGIVSLTFQELLTDKHQEAAMRVELGDKYNALHDEVERWLEINEDKIERLEPIAVDMEQIEKQIEELQVKILRIRVRVTLIYFGVHVYDLGLFHSLLESCLYL